MHQDRELGVGVAAELELRGRFSGRRQERRVHEDFSVLLRGRAGSFLARAVDVSRSGVLMELTDPAAAVGEDMAAFLEVVERHFRSGADIHLSDAAAVVRATLARVSHEGVRLYVAFSFDELLEESVCAVLGLPSSVED